ncbi:MAG: anaerobic ribonucleoside-triphosphate reductase activating protein [Saprospiraceae bacterium]|nr:anaerobic ribonucleoside-triphosphate reductase activating protein [Saprospiraceae bacterium]
MNTNKEFISRNSLQRKIIYSYTPFTLLDYPDKTACILWFAGCNMRCSYCYNPEIVSGKGKYTYEDIKIFLHSRKQLLDAVVLSGGECLLSNGIKDIIMEIKRMGFFVKVDTNASRPDLLGDLIDKNQIDYVALDFKATKAKIFHMTKTDFYHEFLDSLSVLLKSNIKFEVRTTIHSALLNGDDIYEMVNILSELGYCGKYFIQNFRDHSRTLGNPGPSFYDFDLSKCSNKSIQVIER